MHRFRQYLITAVLPAVLLSGPASHWAWAQLPPDSPPGWPPLQSADSKRVHLTYQSVPAMLQKLGFAVATKRDATGTTYFEIVARQGINGRSFPVTVTPFGKPAIEGLVFTGDDGKKFYDMKYACSAITQEEMRTMVRRLLNFIQEHQPPMRVDTAPPADPGD